MVTEKQAERLAGYREDFIKANSDSTKFAGPFTAGDTIKYPTYAKTLQKIMEEGRDGFYKGEVAEKLANFVQENGGLITVEDLEKYEAVWRDPIVFNYKDIKVISMSPPSSGEPTPIAITIWATPILWISLTICY